jgi:predicted nucleic acid-binding protein
MLPAPMAWLTPLSQAIFWYEDKTVDFIDACTAAWMLTRRLATTYAFERKHFSRIEGIGVQVPGE